MFFDPVEATADRWSLVSYKGSDAWQMTVTNELNKLAGNIGIARIFQSCSGINKVGLFWSRPRRQHLRGTLNDNFRAPDGASVRR